MCEQIVRKSSINDELRDCPNALVVIDTVPLVWGIERVRATGSVAKIVARYPARTLKTLKKKTSSTPAGCEKKKKKIEHTFPGPPPPPLHNSNGAYSEFQTEVQYLVVQDI